MRIDTLPLVLVPEGAFVTARSGTVSPFRLAIATPVGFAPTATVAGEAAPKAPLPLPRRMETVPDDVLLTTARSALPSPFRSPVATATGLLIEPVAEDTAKVPLPLPRRTATLSEP